MKEQSLLFTVEKSIFCHEEVKTAKKSSDRACHFELFRFLREKWQKKAKPTVNSRGILFLVIEETECSEECDNFFNLLNFEYETLSNKMI